MEIKHGFVGHWEEGFPEVGPAKKVKYGFGTGKSLKYDACDTSRFRDPSSVLYMHRGVNGDQILESISLDKDRNWNILENRELMHVPKVDGYNKKQFCRTHDLHRKIEAHVGYYKCTPKDVAPNDGEYEIRRGRKGKTIHQKRPKGKRVSSNSRQENHEQKPVDAYMILFERQDPKKYPSYHKNSARTPRDGSGHTPRWFECRDIDQDLRAACKKGHGATSVIDILEGPQHGEDIALSVAEATAPTAAPSSASQARSAPDQSVRTAPAVAAASTCPADTRSKRPKKLRKPRRPTTTLAVDDVPLYQPKPRHRSSSSRPREANVDTSTTCGHGCEVSRLSRQCCFCGDRRPKRDRYLQYVDGLGSTRGASRHMFYCPTCRTRVAPETTGDNAESESRRDERGGEWGAGGGDVKADNAEVAVVELQRRVACLVTPSTSDPPTASPDGVVGAGVGVGVEGGADDDAATPEEEEEEDGSADCGGHDDDEDDEGGWVTVDPADASSEGSGEESSEGSTGDWVEVTAE